MCGIFFCLSQAHNHAQELLEVLGPALENRGPDCCHQVDLTLDDKKTMFLTMRGCVLWLRGLRVTPQPYSDSEGNLLLWNGDIFSSDFHLNDSISDTQALGDMLRNVRDEDIPQVLSKIHGPFAVIYFRMKSGQVFFGRDFFGRHCLLAEVSPHRMVFTSVGHKSLPGLIEVPAAGIFQADVASYFKTCETTLKLFPWKEKQTELKDFPKFELGDELVPSVEKINVQLVPDDLPSSDKNGINCTRILSLMQDPEFKDRVDQFTSVLRQSVETRVRMLPSVCKNCRVMVDNRCSHSKIGILFSGGLDSTVLAALTDQCLKEGESIDLLTVAFQQVDGSFNVPDRSTAIKALQELEALNPVRRYNLVLIDIGRDELASTRDEIISNLLHPLNTVLDDSIGCAIWFAARGKGKLYREPGNSSDDYYTSPARVVLLGAGADEQLAGYSRHRARFQTSGWVGLLEEVQIEMMRISERNMGRDNRIVSDHGREGRYPFLSEGVVDYLNSLQIHHKADLRFERGLGEKLLLRAAAFNLGLKGVAFEPKRAIQFGSRIARMENRKEKGTDKAIR